MLRGFVMLIKGAPSIPDMRDKPQSSKRKVSKYSV